VRSTPIPCEAVRLTVKLALFPPLRRRMIVPRNSCTRSRSPSLMRTKTLTVSPGRNSGMLGFIGASRAFNCSLIIFTVVLIYTRPAAQRAGRRTSKYTIRAQEPSRESVIGQENGSCRCVRARKRPASVLASRTSLRVIRSWISSQVNCSTCSSSSSSGVSDAGVRSSAMKK
jgi:hypothetical protein